MTRAARLASILLGAAGIALFLVAWEIVGRNRLVGLTWPPFSVVVTFLVDPSRRELFARALAATLASAVTGYGIGAGVGMALALVGHLWPILRGGADRTASVVHAIPSIALAPIFVLILSRDAAPAGLAGLNAFFVFYVTATSGLATTTAAQQALMGVLGASRLQRLVHVDLPAAIPALVTGVKLAIPGALIGAILGEWFGAPRGLGILIVNAMQNFQIPLLWSAVLLTALTSLLLFGAATVLERLAYDRFR
jgi:NitT/TauT family transport system permease protein